METKRNCFKRDDLNRRIAYLNCHNIGPLNTPTILNEVGSLLDGNVFDIFAITERWLKGNFCSLSVSVVGYPEMIKHLSWEMELVFINLLNSIIKTEHPFRLISMFIRELHLLLVTFSQERILRCFAMVRQYHLVFCTTRFSFHHSLSKVWVLNRSFIKKVLRNPILVQPLIIYSESTLVSCISPTQLTANLSSLTELFSIILYLHLVARIPVDLFRLTCCMSYFYLFLNILPSFC